MPHVCRMYHSLSRDECAHKPRRVFVTYASIFTTNYTLLINCLIIPHQGRSSKDIDKYLVDNSIPILCSTKPLLLIMINHDSPSAKRARPVRKPGWSILLFWNGPSRSLGVSRSCCAARAITHSLYFVVPILL